MARLSNIGDFTHVLSAIEGGHELRHPIDVGADFKAASGQPQTLGQPLNISFDLN